MYRVGVGTENPLKIRAVKQAFYGVQVPNWWEVIGCAALSGVREQPVGFEETLRGAKNRALGALEMVPDARVYLGIESGILRAGGVSIDLAVVVAVTPAPDPSQEPRFRFSTSPGVTFPEHYVEEALREGLTVGRVVARHRHYADAANPHAALTGQQITRVHTLIAGIDAVLRQIPAPYFNRGVLAPPHQ